MITTIKRTRLFLGLFLSLLFHFLIFVLFADISVFPVQSAPLERTRILAEVMLFPAPNRQTEKPEGQNNTENTARPEKIQIKNEIKTEPQKIITEAAKAPAPQKIIPEPVKTPEPRRTIPEPAKTPEPPAPRAEPPRNPTNTANTAQNRTEDRTQYRQDTNTDRMDIPKESGISGNAASLSPLRSAPSIAAVDSVIIVNRVRPVYPQISRRRGEEGNVVLLADVKNGKVMNVTIEKSSGIKALDSSASAAVGKWSFSSDTNLTVRIPVSFQLKD